MATQTLTGRRGEDGFSGEVQKAIDKPVTDVQLWPLQHGMLVNKINCNSMDIK